MVPVARRRKSQFRDTQEMFERYRPARVFREIDDFGLRAYIDALAVPTPDGVALSFPPAPPQPSPFRGGSQTGSLGWRRSPRYQAPAW